MERQEKYLVALVQMNGVFLDVRRNTQAAEAAVREAAGKGAKLIVFPEALLTGYQADRLAEACMLAEPEGRPNMQGFRKLARECGVFLLVPFFEKRGEGVFNSAVLIDDNGQDAGVYSKTHLTGSEKGILLAGDRLSVWDTPLGRIGCLICYDICFPETVRSLALSGAQVILVPAAWGSEKYYRNWWDLNVACRALDNLVYLAAVNRPGSAGGEGFAGRSKVCDPVGTVIGQCGDSSEEILYAEIDLNRIGAERADNTVLDDLRPGLYDIGQ